MKQPAHVKLMLVASGGLALLNAGLALGDICFGIWKDLFRDTLMAASNLIIFLTWKLLF